MTKKLAICSNFFHFFDLVEETKFISSIRMLLSRFGEIKDIKVKLYETSELKLFDSFEFSKVLKTV